MKHTIQAGKFKAECLRLMDQVNISQTELIITKRNVPIAKLVPIKTKRESLFGKMKGTATISGDIIEPIDEAWDVCS